LSAPVADLMHRDAHCGGHRTVAAERLRRKTPTRRVTSEHELLEPSRGSGRRYYAWSDDVVLIVRYVIRLIAFQTLTLVRPRSLTLKPFILVYLAAPRYTTHQQAIGRDLMTIAFLTTWVVVSSAGALVFGGATGLVIAIVSAAVCGSWVARHP